MTNRHNMSAQRWRDFAPLRTSRLRGARAWAINESAMRLWNYTRRGWADISPPED